MKRSPMPRATKPMKRTTWLRAKSPLRATGKPSKRFAKRRQPEFTAWIRTLPCVVAGQGCWGSIVAAHVWKTRGAGAWDRGFVVPACEGHHAEQEGRTARFNRKYGVDLEHIAATLAA